MNVKMIGLLILVPTVAVAGWRITVGKPLTYEMTEDGSGVELSQSRAALDRNRLSSGQDEDLDPEIVNADQQEFELAEEGEVAALLTSPKSIDEKRWAEAVGFLRSAAKKNDKALLEELRNLPADCPGCKKFFSNARGLMSRDDLSYDEKAFIARALAASKSPENQAFLVKEMNSNASNSAISAETGMPVNDNLLPPAAIAKALENEELAPPVVDQLDESLQSENRWVRDAAVSILTKQGSVEAIQKLYDYTVELGRPDGFYRDGMGIGMVTPKPEAFPYLAEKVRAHDKYSHLFLKALLNAGDQGRDLAISLITEITDAATPDRELIKSAVDHLPLHGPAFNQVQSLVGSSNATVRQLAMQAINEHDSQIAEQNKVFENNEFSDQGLRTDLP